MATELGSPASHTALLARTLGVPAVVAVPELLVKVAEGSPIVVDGFRGEVLLQPSELELQQAEERQNRFAEFRNRLEPNADGQAESRDGVTVGVWANLELPEEAGLAAVAGVAGVGLYRSEFLFLERRHAPSEDEQAEVYKEVVLTMKPRPVVIRTMDIGGDKVLEGGLRVAPPNPALGLRGLRLSLHREHELFRPQLRAILRAATSGPVRIMFPMVTDANEFLRARRVVEDCIEELHGEGESVTEVRVGAMVELPSAVLGVERLVKVADFLSVGSNDLTQYVLGADRANPAVAAYSGGLHPSVLQMLNRVVAAAQGAGVPVSLCGDMASDPFALPLVVGLCFRAITVPAPAFALAHEVVSRISIREAVEVADECLGYVDSETVRSRVIEHFRDQLRIIWEAYGVF